VDDRIGHDYHSTVMTERKMAVKLAAAIEEGGRMLTVRAWLALAALVSCVSSSAPPPASTVATVAPAPPTVAPPTVGGTGSLLGDHLVMDVPERAEQSARPHSIMAAPAARQDETRIIIEPGAEMARFVVFARELYASATADVLADAKRVAAPDEGVERFDLGGGLRAAEITRGAPPRPPQPLRVLSLVVAHPDGTLQEVVFLILSQMANERDAYLAKARALAKSLRPGSRRIDAPGGEAKLGSDLVVTLPRGFIVSTQPGPDFDVHRIRKLTPLDRAAGVLGIYVGGHPSLQIAQHGERGPPPASSTEKGSLLGKEVGWVKWKTEEGTLVREAVASLGEHDAVHVFAFSPDEAAEREWANIAATLRPAGAR
jgi:hypothetical protein